MRWTDSTRQYSTASVTLHWLVALLIVIMLALGVYASDLPNGPERGAMLALHKSIGVVAAGLIVLRIAWRVRNGFMPLATGIPRWQRRIARATHAGLLIATLMMPVSGYLGGHAITVFNLVYIEAPHTNKALSKAMHRLHSLTAEVLVALILLHLAGALKHQFVDRDGTLRKMLGRESDS